MKNKTISKQVLGHYADIFLKSIRNNKKRAKWRIIRVMTRVISDELTHNHDDRKNINKNICMIIQSYKFKKSNLN